MPEPTHVLCRNETTGGEAEIPADALRIWAPRGWAPVPEEELAQRAAEEAAEQARLEAEVLERIAAAQASDGDEAEQTESPSGGEDQDTEGAAAVGPDLEKE